MKTIAFKNFIFTMFVTLLYLSNANAQIGIGTNAPNSAASLDLSSTTKGFLPPRMTLAQIDSINSPVKGLMVWCSNCGNKGEMQIYNGFIWTNLTGYNTSPIFTCGSTITFNYNGSSVTYGTVSYAGNCWLDRNLGATQVATSTSDVNGLGHIFQWGRLADGHQIRTSLTISTTSSTDVPTGTNSSRFFFNVADWRSPSNDLLWQGTSGYNNPCPTGFRLPTSAEFELVRTTVSTNVVNQTTQAFFNAAIKLPATGNRNATTGSMTQSGISSWYWTKTLTNGAPTYFTTYVAGNATGQASLKEAGRAFGMAVRCIQN